MAALAGGLAGRAANAAPAEFPDSATLLVAGPPGGRTDRWAELLAGPLSRALLQGGTVSRQDVGGPDGVTGANQFEANALPDGSMALVCPGEAALSWLAGDPRVTFDAARWIPVWAATASSGVVSRVRLVPGQRVRYAVGTTVGPELAGMLALDLLGVDLVPVAAGPDADAMFVQGRALHDAARNGMRPAFSFGALNAAGEVVRDPELPELPTAEEMVARLRPEAPMRAGLRAITAAVQLDLALVLPQLSPAAIVAWWRRGCEAIGQSPALQVEATRSLLHPMAPTMASVNLAAITVNVPVLLEVRRWLSARNRWHPI